MKYPTRPIRTVDPHTANYEYYDSEIVEQDDGTFAMFGITNYTQEWRFQHMVDKYKFMIWTDELRKRMWNDKITQEQHLLESKQESSRHSTVEDIGCGFRIADDESIHPYEYGGPLSERGGWFIVKKDEPNKIIRSKQTWMS